MFWKMQIYKINLISLHKNNWTYSLFMTHKIRETMQKCQKLLYQNSILSLSLQNSMCKLYLQRSTLWVKRSESSRLNLRVKHKDALVQTLHSQLWSDLITKNKLKWNKFYCIKNYLHFQQFVHSIELNFAEDCFVKANQYLNYKIAEWWEIHKTEKSVKSTWDNLKKFLKSLFEDCENWVYNA